MNSKHRYPVVSLRVTDEDSAEWQQIARDLKTNVSNLLMEALAAYGRHHITKKGESP